jgi:hypothetical protein
MSRAATLVIGLIALAIQARPASAQGGAGDLSQLPERAREIAILKQLVSEVEAQKRVALTPMGTSSYGLIMIVDRNQVGGMATWLAQSGQISPDSIQSWVGKQLATSRQILGVMKEQLARLEAGEEWSPPPTEAGPNRRTPPGAGSVPGDVSWPTNMNWGEVTGTVRGSYRIQCYYDERRVPEIQGTFTLTLRGRNSGVVLGSYTDGNRVREANGIIHNDGQAGGNGRASDASIVWSVKFARDGNKLVIQSPSLIMAPNEAKARCDRGVMEQE